MSNGKKRNNRKRDGRRNGSGRSAESEDHQGQTQIQTQVLEPQLPVPTGKKLVPPRDPEASSGSEDQKDSGHGDHHEPAAASNGNNRPPRKEMSEAEKLQALDDLSKASASGLLAQLSLLSNKAKPEYEIKIEKAEPEAESGARDPAAAPSPKFYMNLVARYCEMKVTVPRIPGRSEKFARRVGADLILAKLYGEDHTMDHETEVMQKEFSGITYEVDREWYEEKEKEAQKVRDKKVDRMVNRLDINDKLSAEEKAKRKAKFEAWRNPLQTNLKYDDIYRKFDHPYFRVLCNVIKRVGFRMKCRITKTVNGIETEVARKGEKRNNTNSASDPDSAEHSSSEEGSRGLAKYSVSLTVSNRYAPGKVLTEVFHSDETDILKEVKSEAAYQALKKLLVQGLLRTIGRLDAKFPERAHSRFARRRPRPNHHRNNRANHRSKSGGKVSTGGSHQNSARSSKNGHQPANQPNLNGSGDHNNNVAKKGKALPTNPGQTIMMPVTFNSKGQYVIMKDAQPMIVQSAAGGPSKTKKKRRSPKSRKDNGKKNVGEAAASAAVPAPVPSAGPAMVGITEGVNNVAIAAN